MGEKSDDDFGINLDDIDDLEYQATQFFSTQHFPNAPEDKENEPNALVSVAGKKRRLGEVDHEPPSKIAKNLSENGKESSAVPVFRNTPNIYRILSVLFSLEICDKNIEILKNLLYDLSEYIFDDENISDEILNDLVNYSSKNLKDLAKFGGLFNPSLLVLKLIIRMQFFNDSEFISALGKFCQIVIDQCSSFEILNSLSNLFLDLSLNSIDLVFIKPYCLLGLFCARFKGLRMDALSSCKVFLNIVYSCKIPPKGWENYDCACFKEYFDVFFGLVQTVIENHSKIMRNDMVFGMDFCVDLIYECIKQIFTFASLIVNDQEKTRLNIRYQYVILAGAPIVYKYRKMSQKEVQEMDEMLAREPGIEQTDRVVL